jgi:head-tail adaptor
LNRKLLLEEASQTPDGAGGFIETWAVLGTLWAHIKPGTGRERGVDFVTLSSVPYRITVRAAPDGAPSRPKPNQRFRDGGRIYRIVAVTEADDAAQYLVCFAHEEVSA